MDLANPLANLKMEEDFYHNIHTHVMKKIDDAPPLRIIDSDGQCRMIPSSFKLFSKLIANICSSIPSTDDIVISVPDCSGSAIISLLELFSSGTIKKGIGENPYIGKVKEEIDQNLKLVDDLIEAGILFDVNICRESILCDIKTNQLDCHGTIENVELFLKSSECQDGMIEGELLNSENIVKGENHLDILDDNVSKFDSSCHSTVKQIPQDYDEMKSNVACVVKIASFAKLVSTAPNLVSTADKNDYEDSGRFDNNVNESRTSNDISVKQDMTYYWCRFCNCRVKGKTRLDSHEYDTHIVVKRCTECDFSCIEKKVMASHQRRMHKNILCAECKHSSVFLAAQELEQHIQKFHVHFKCLLCNFFGQGLKLLQKHMKVVHNKRGVKFKDLKTALV